MPVVFEKTNTETAASTLTCPTKLYVSAKFWVDNRAPSDMRAMHPTTDALRLGLSLSSVRGYCYRSLRKDGRLVTVGDFKTAYSQR